LFSVVSLVSAKTVGKIQRDPILDRQNDDEIHTDLRLNRQNDGEIQTDLPFASKNDEQEPTLAIILDRQNDGSIHTDLVLNRQNDEQDLTPATILDREEIAESRRLNTCECAAPPAGTDRIVGGSIVNPKYKYPFQAYFQANGYMCGGTIINKRYIVTAMHCLFDKHGHEHPASRCSVVLGEHNLSDGNNEGGQIIGVEKFIKRDDYNSVTHVNDIAILKLIKDITFTANIKPACLPRDSSKTYDNEWATVIGWGGTVGYDGGEQVNQVSSTAALKETWVKVIAPSDNKCKVITKGNSRTMLCGYNQGTDSCQGDSGGPLTLVENGKYTLIGVVSVGYGCASIYPGVYARVTTYLSWIKSITASGDCSSTGPPTACNYTDHYPGWWCRENKMHCTNTRWFQDLCLKTCKCACTYTDEYPDWCQKNKMHCNTNASWGPWFQGICSKTCKC